MSLTFTHAELIELLRNRENFEDRIAARAATRLEKAIALLQLLREKKVPVPDAEIDAFLSTAD